MISLLLWALVSVATAQLRFEERKLPFVLDNGAQGDFRLVELMLGGVAALDYDNDGCADLFFTNGAALPDFDKAAARYSNRLYKGDCALGFADVTAAAGVAGQGYSMGAAAADYDNDGRTDLFVAGVDRNLLYHNEGGGRFAEVTRKAGLAAAGNKPWAVAAGWFDYNHDGHLDLLVVHYVVWSAATEPRCGTSGARFYCHPNAFPPQPNQLYRNNGDGTFTDVSRAAGIAAHAGKGMSAAFADFDRDGWMDVFVPNDSMRGFLFRNQCDGTFRETGLEAGVAYREDGAAIAGMGADFRDYNNDGHPDLLVTGMINDTFLLFRNLGVRWQFDDDRPRTGLLLATRPYTGWGAGIQDFDNDGWKDLFFALAHFPRMERFTGSSAALPCRVFRNNGRQFVQQSGGLDTAAFHRGAAFADFDNDGRVDAVVSAIGSPARLLHNVSDAGQWLALRLQGTRSNRDGIGATVTVTLASGRVLSNHATTSVGYASSSENLVRFGLGSDRKALQVEVVWPGGARQSLGALEAGKVHVVRQP